MENFIKNIEFEIKQDSNEAYHSHTNFIGASGLKLIKKSPAHYQQSLLEKTEPTEAMIFGSAYHTYCLEKEKFDSEYYIYDESDIMQILISEGSKKPRATNKYKEWYENEITKAAGRTMFDTNTLNRIQYMSKKMKSHIYCNSLLNGGENEISIYAEITTFEDKKIKIKIRPDKWKQDKRLCVDLKSTSDSSINEFPRHAANFDYHIQAALYTMILEKISGNNLSYKFFFIAQEKSAPYNFNIFESSSQFLSQGKYEVEMLLMLYSYCIENNTFPGYQVYCENKFGVYELNLPPYTIHEINYFDHKMYNNGN